MSRIHSFSIMLLFSWTLILGMVFLPINASAATAGEGLTQSSDANNSLHAEDYKQKDVVKTRNYCRF